jgi:hypothetical protein
MADPGVAGESVSIGYRDDRSAAATWRNLFVVVLRQRAGAERLRRYRRVLERHVAAWPGQYASVTVLEATAYSETVPADEREEMARMMRDFHGLGSAVVLEGTGFRPAAARTMLAGVYLITRPPYPHKVFDAVDLAARWAASTG